MFEHLDLQIQHQYGKFLHFNEAANGNNDPVKGIRDNNGSYYKDETIVHFVPQKDKQGDDAYQIQHQYGKFLHFNEAANGNNDPVKGIRENSWSFYRDETIVHLIPTKDKDGNNAYQIQHQYGKYLHFNEAANGYNDPVKGIRESHRSFYRDETILHLIPLNYTLVIKVEDFQYGSIDKTACYIESQTLLTRKFTNNSDSEHESSINHNVSKHRSITFKHSSNVVEKWLNKVSGGVEITTKNISLHEAELKAYCNCEYTWTKYSIHSFNTSTTKDVKEDIVINDKIKIQPQSETTYEYCYKKTSGTKIPYQANMKVSCKVSGNFISRKDLEFILYNKVCGYPQGGDLQTIDNRGVCCIPLTGEIVPDITEIESKVDTVSLVRH